MGSQEKVKQRKSMRKICLHRSVNVAKDFVQRRRRRNQSDWTRVSWAVFPFVGLEWFERAHRDERPTRVIERTPSTSSCPSQYSEVEITHEGNPMLREPHWSSPHWCSTWIWRWAFFDKFQSIWKQNQPVDSATNKYIYIYECIYVWVCVCIHN